MVDGDFDLIHFHGKHAMEREFERSPLAHGKLRLESKRGTSSHQQNPFVILAKKGTNEVSGDCIGAAFVYSGSFIIEAEVDQVNQTRLVVGLHPEQFEYILNAGEELVLPEVAFTYQSPSPFVSSYLSPNQPSSITSRFIPRAFPSLASSMIFSPVKLK